MSDPELVAQIDAAVAAAEGPVPPFVVLDQLGNEIGRWGEEPLGVDEVMGALTAVWDYDWYGWGPNALAVPMVSWWRMACDIKRRTLSRRAFRRWRGKQRKAFRTASPAEPDLPDGVWERGGQLFYTCRSCGQDAPLECELHEFDPDVAYCGGSPRCLP